MQVFRSLVTVALVLGLVTPSLAQDRPRIVTVNYALQYLAERLTGGEAEVIFPVPAGVDPSFWRPSIADITMIQSADLILLNGAGFATWVDRVSLPRAKTVNTSAKIKDQFISTESITHSHGDGGEHSHEGLASYLWLDPTLAIAQAEAVAAAMASRDLVPASEIYASFAELRSELEKLDASTADALATARGIPMIATHPRYQYLAQRYDLSITSLEWEAGAMPTQEELADLERLVAELDARILIWEAQPPREGIEAADALGLESVVFNPLARASADDSFVEAYASAVSDLSDAVSSSRN